MAFEKNNQWVLFLGILLTRILKKMFSFWQGHSTVRVQGICEKQDVSDHIFKMGAKAGRTSFWAQIFEVVLHFHKLTFSRGNQKWVQESLYENPDFYRG